MARIFSGNRTKVDRAVLDAAHTLPDDYWVLAEFDLNGRNIDWLILRPVPDERPEGACATIILTELKRTSATLDGAEHGRWRERRNGLWAELTPANMADENPWQQTLNTQGALCAWLHNHQRRFLLAPPQLYPPTAFRAWPQLLILSDPPNTIHQLPLRPQGRFGQFHYDLADWLATVRDWKPQVGLPLTTAELARLVTALGLRELAPQCPVAATPHERPVPATPAARPADPNLSWLPDFVRWATDLEARVRVLEARLAAQGAAPPCPPPASALDEARALLARSGIAPAQAHAAVSQTPATKAAKSAKEGASTAKTTTRASDPPAKTAPSVAADRPLTPEERDCITAALAALRAGDKARTFSGLFHELAQRNGGVSLKQQRYNGFRNARALLDRAVAEGLIRYGPLDAAQTPTLYFPDEAIPKGSSKQ